jgi:hypothetical protein
LVLAREGGTALQGAGKDSTRNIGARKNHRKHKMKRSPNDTLNISFF